MKAFFNIALLGRDFLWGGGMDLLRGIANALLAMQAEQRARLFLLLPVRNRVDTFADAVGVIRKTAREFAQGKNLYLRREHVVDPTFFDFLQYVDGELAIVEYNDEIGLLAALKRIEADVVLPVFGPLGAGFPVPWVGYLYDFQHKYFPGYFCARELFNREIHFATMLRDAKAVIVNAKAVKDDIDRFFPFRECQVFDLPFSAAPTLNWLEDSDRGVKGRYRLPSRYFIISNQFWVHKSHITAFKALSIILSDKHYNDVHIVCTGKMEDHRFPEYTKDLLKQVHEMGIDNNVLFLGHIPKIDQIAIMKNSIAVLQPTLFEGGPGGGSVFDAVSLGVPAIISDIPINLEIKNEENIFYFETDSPDSLAEKIKILLDMNIVRLSKEKLILLGEKRKRLLCETLLRAIEISLNQ